jgi:hypothetical protein
MPCFNADGMFEFITVARYESSCRFAVLLSHDGEEVVEDDEDDDDGTDDEEAGGGGGGGN